jgi:hypothetical protein
MLILGLAGLVLSNLQNREHVGKLFGWIAIVLALTMVAGCETTTVQQLGGARMLTGFEMDRVTAGSAFAATDAAARARGSTPRASVLGTAAAYHGDSPILGAPFLDFANSQAKAAANADDLAQAGLSVRVFVDSTNGGASIDAGAAGTGANRAEVTAQFYGISTNRADLVFGSVAAVACCGSDAGAQVKLASRTGGPYSRELRGAPVSDTPEQIQSRVDIAVVSSAFPVLEPAQVWVAGAPTRVSPKY